MDLADCKVGIIEVIMHARQSHESMFVADPINPVHSGTIRELAVSPIKSSYVLSGGKRVGGLSYRSRSR